MKLIATVVLFVGLATLCPAQVHPSAQDITNAKSEGLVWTDPDAHVYHKDGEHFGTTKHGKFVTEAEARQQHFKLAKEPVKSKQPAKKDQSGLDDSANTHSSTPPKQ